MRPESTQTCHQANAGRAGGSILTPSPIGIGVANNRAQDVTTYRYGTAGRNVLIGPPIVGVDMSVNKNWALRENYRLELRGEFFNLPNHPIFGQPGTSPGSSTYGVIGATRIDPRDIQLALKLVF